MNFRALSPENILKYISPLDIYKRYSSGFKFVGRHFKAEFRNDPKPSAIIYEYNGTYLYKDFGEYGSNNCFQFVMRKLELGFIDTLMKINEDFNLNLYGNSSAKEPKYQTTIIEKQQEFRTIIEIKKRDWRNEDLVWWWNQSWTKEMLNLAKIKPINYFRLTSERKGIDKQLFLCEDYSYSIDYYWHNNIFRRKIYQPKKPDFKWLSNVDNTVVQNWHLFPKNGDIGFISSSYKDGGPIWRIYNSPIFVAPNNEGSFLPEKVWHKIKPRYKRWIILFDNDLAGITNARRYSQMYDIEYYHNPLIAPKDPSDMWIRDGGREFNFYLQKYLNET